MYPAPPVGDVALEDFERFAIDRLRVLKGIEDAKSRGKKGDQLQGAVKDLTDKHLAAATGKRKADTWKDQVSHFVLRLAYCRTAELRRWFLQWESELFRWRFARQLSDDQAHFMRVHGLPYIEIDQAEFRELKDQLRTVQLSMGNKAVADEINKAANYTFYKVPFEQVPDLVASRRVLLKRGWAYVAKHDVPSLVVGHFRANLSKGLVETARKWASQIAHEEEDRLTPIVESLSIRYLGPDYGDAAQQGKRGEVSAGQIPSLVKSFPLCMANLYDHLHTDNHLRHGGRMQFGLFLKGIGLPMDEALKFFRAEFAPKMASDKFEREHAYSVRYNYGKEGKRQDWTPYSCIKIISQTPGVGDYHGCPYKTMDAPSLDAALRRLRIDPKKITEAVGKAKGGHFQLACASAWAGAHACSCDTGINHPNQYYDESRKVLDPTPTADAAANGTPAAGKGAPPMTPATEVKPAARSLLQAAAANNAPGSAPPRLQPY
ncbi:hypothetical protein WJX72_008093 [[Myrmecia] bisecta]|uniref:DNA primase large subunit n=1 Tax=[Myrmecia] bisecta TaxID=41462 RepID=A0AAW1QAX5_9CHLO